MAACSSVGHFAAQSFNLFGRSSARSLGLFTVLFNHCWVYVVSQKGLFLIIRRQKKVLI